MSEFYTIETPPSSSSTSKDSMDDSITLISKKNQMKLFLDSKTDEVNASYYEYLSQRKCKTKDNYIE